LTQFNLSRVRASTSDNDDGNQHYDNHRADSEPDAHMEYNSP
jgi:hypothetical protein